MSMPDYPPDPNPPPITTPPVTGTPASDYTVPQQFTPPAPSGRADPLVPPANASYGTWFSAVQAVARRSWKSTLIISAIGIAAPLAVLSLLSYSMDVGGVISILTPFRHPGGTLVKLLISIGVAFVASIGWAAGTWALVNEARTGQPANVNAAFQYGVKRAMALFPWAVIAGVACVVALTLLTIPGLYLAFAFSMFGFVAIFERNGTPLMRSLNLVHGSIGPALAKVGTLFGIFLVYYGVKSLIVVIISLPFRILTRSSQGIGVGFVEMIGTVLLAPAIAFLMIGLLVTYGELRAKEAPTSTDDLAAQLG